MLFSIAAVCDSMYFTYSEAVEMSPQKVLQTLVNIEIKLEKALLSVMKH
jgi:hypothetical protein